jgi:hypothetical protein
MGRLYFSDALKDDHIFRLTDDTGIMQHSKYSLPDPNHGYTTDDNARALIMALMLYERYEKKKYLDLVYRYSSFILSAQNSKGKFKNFMGYDRKWLEEEGSEDCFGRCLWALGFGLSNEYTPQGVKHGLSHILKNAMPHAAALNSPRAKAYSIIGLARFEGEDARRLVFETAQSLCRQYEEYRDGEWKWFEDIVAYCNNVLPWSLISAHRATGEKKFLDIAEESLEFLGSVSFKDGYFKPVGCNGWLLKGGHPAEFDEQMVEACEAVLTYLEAYEATGKKKYLQKAKRCHAWYEGANSKGISLVDSETGGCYDGLTQHGVNLNMGAESLVSYVISYMKISESFEGGLKASSF